METKQEHKIIIIIRTNNNTNNNIKYETNKNTNKTNDNINDIRRNTQYI